MSKKLLKSLSSYDGTLSKESEILFGDLGVRRGGKVLVSVPNRPQFVYVRLRTKLSELIEAFNGDKVAQVYDLPVKIKRDGNRYIIIGRNNEVYSDWQTENPYLPKHAKTHVFDKDGGNIGGDTVWVYPYQFMPGLVAPFGSRGATNVFIHQTFVRDLDGNWKTIGNTGTERLTQFNPTSGSCLVLISIDTVSGNPVYNVSTGSYISESLTGTSELLPYLSTDYDYYEVPVSFVRLVSGTSSIGWNHLHDVRQFLIPHPTGTSGGGSYTDEQAQDAVGGILTGTTSIQLTYDDATPRITATVQVNGINDTHIDWGTGSNQISLDNIPDGITRILNGSSANYLITEDLSSQIDGMTDHFSLTWAALTKPMVYCNLRQLPSDITMDADMLGFTLSYTPTTDDKLVVDYYPGSPDDVFIYDNSGNILIDNNGEFILEV